jgi:hypothetical protein
MEIVMADFEAGDDGAPGDMGVQSLALFLPGHKPLATNLLEPAHMWRGPQPFDLSALRKTRNSDGSPLYGLRRDIPVRNYPLVLHVDVLRFDTVDVKDDKKLGDQAFKKLVLTAELRPAK